MHGGAGVGDPVDLETWRPPHSRPPDVVVVVALVGA